MKKLGYILPGGKAPQPGTAYADCMAEWKRERVEELRLEIADIQAANRRYEVSSNHNHMTEQAYENRRLRLVQIMQELDAIRKDAA